MERLEHGKDGVERVEHGELEEDGVWRAQMERGSKHGERNGERLEGMPKHGERHLYSNGERG